MYNSKIQGIEFSGETSAFPFTATEDGILVITIVPSSGSSDNYLYIADQNNNHFRIYTNAYSDTTSIPVPKGTTLTTQQTGGTYTLHLYWYPFKKA